MDIVCADCGKFVGIGPVEVSYLRCNKCETILLNQGVEEEERESEDVRDPDVGTVAWPEQNNYIGDSDILY